MAYLPDELIIDDWVSPISIIGTDAISQLDEAVNDIITLDPASMVNFINAQMAKIPPYLTIELEKVYTETAAHAGAAQASAAAAQSSAAAALVSENNAKASETAAAGSAASAVNSAASAGNSAASAVTDASTATNKAGEATASAAAALSSEQAAETSENNASTSATNSENSAIRAEAVAAGKAVLSIIDGITALRVVNEVVMLDTDYAALQAGAGTDPETIYNLYEV